MHRSLSILAALLLPAAAAAAPRSSGGVTIESGTFRYEIGGDGQNRHFIDKRTGLDVLDRKTPSLCARALQAGRWIPVTSASTEAGKIVLRFGDAGPAATIAVRPGKDHAVLEVVSVAGAGVEEVVFVEAPLAADPAEPFGACALALNLQTNVVEFPGLAKRLAATAYARFGFAGARVALVGCAPKEMRKALQRVVTDAPDLPKSKFGGPWALDEPSTRGSYLFDFGTLNESTVDDWIRLAKSIGFTQIDFHGGRSFRFGDCLVNPEVHPRGVEGLKAAIDRLHVAGLQAGLHTYAFFIDKKCPWVTPVPDPRLAAAATFILAGDLAADAATVPVGESTAAVTAVTGFFVRNSVTLQIDDELVEFTGASPEPPFGFTGCRRGALGTRAAPHAAGAKVRHLKEMFGLFVPDPETTLFAEVAQKTADLYDAAGFDMVYLDALDGEGILAGDAWGWHYGSKFAYEVARRLKRPALMEMSTFHHHLWAVRSRAGAWDHPRRGYATFIDRHAADNERYRRMFLPSQLGWWSILPWTGPESEPTLPDDIEYLCAKALGWDSGLSLMGITPETAGRGGMPRLTEILGRWETLRRKGGIPEAVKQRLREPGAAFRLDAEGAGGKPRFIPVRHDRHRVESIEDGSRAWRVENGSGRQPARVRIQALMSVAPYDAPEGVVLADAGSAGAFAERGSAAGVAAEFSSAPGEVRPGLGGLAFVATNGSGSPRGAWAKAVRKFETPLNLGGPRGIGFWVRGDGGGGVLNVQLRSPDHLAAGIGEHYVDLDFTGWRYVERVEPEGERFEELAWPYGNPYAIYRESVHDDQVASAALWLNRLPPGRRTETMMTPVRALPLVKAVLRRPAITINKKTVAYPGELESGSILELDPDGVWRLYGPDGERKAESRVEGDPPVLKPGANEVSFSCDPLPGGIRPRAWVSVFCEGKPVQ